MRQLARSDTNPAPPVEAGAVRRACGSARACGLRWRIRLQRHAGAPPLTVPTTGAATPPARRPTSTKTTSSTQNSTGSNSNSGSTTGSGSNSTPSTDTTTNTGGGQTGLGGGTGYAPASTTHRHNAVDLDDRRRRSSVTGRLGRVDPFALGVIVVIAAAILASCLAARASAGKRLSEFGAHGRDPETRNLASNQPVTQRISRRCSRSQTRAGVPVDCRSARWRMRSGSSAASSRPSVASSGPPAARG